MLACPLKAEHIRVCEDLPPTVPAERAEAKADPYLTRQGRYESNARSYPRRIPIALRSARGIHVTDTAGRSYIDCLSGAGALALGHGHPVVVEAVQRAIAEDLPWQSLDLTSPVKDRFVEDLYASLPVGLARTAKVQFCSPSGADAVEAALKLVKTATGRRSVIAFHGAYHGMTHGALSLTGETGPKVPVSGLMPDVHVLPYPYDYRCPFGIGGATAHRLMSRYLEHLLDDPHSGITPPAAVILEVVQGEGGVIPAPDAWLREVRRITAERGIPLIVDEVQTGVGRTGRLYACEHAGIIPDVMVLSKAIGGGLPLSLIVYQEVLDQWRPGAHAGTFRGNQLAMTAGSATLRYVTQHELWRHAGAMGERLIGALEALLGETRTIGDVRGRGLMIGVEVVHPDRPAGEGAAPAAAPSMAHRIQQECLRLGLIVERGGRHDSVVRFLPPLVVGPSDIDEIAARFSAAVHAAESQG
jgi:diaminobutyrate-2-oxoglutarate transaminase